MNNDLLKVFETESDYDSAKDSFVYPTISYVKETDKLLYMAKPLRNYFFIEALADGMTVALNNTIQMDGMGSINAPANELEYSTDQQVWRRLPNNIASTRVNAGERIYLRGNATSAFDMTNMMMGIGFFNITQSCNVGGNIMSLLFNDDFEDKTDLTGYDYAFAGLFIQQPIVNATRLILPATTLATSCYGMMFAGCTQLEVAPALPATTLADGCYSTMFSGCTSLTTAPGLPAPVLTEGCYNHMFYGCSNLKNITMLATDISAPDCLTDWIANGYRRTGTFVKHVDMNDLPEGVEDWRIKNATLGTLPEYDTAGLATHFVDGEVYANVVPLFQTIRSYYNSECGFNLMSQLLETNYDAPFVYVGNQPLYLDYLTNFTYETHTSNIVKKFIARFIGIRLNLDESDYEETLCDISVDGYQLYVSIDSNGQCRWNLLA